MQIWTRIFKGFKAYLLMERSLSDNTIEAYLRDMNKLVEYLELNELELSPTSISTKDLEAFIIWLNQLGLGARSQARVLSTLKAFFKYLLIEDEIQEDPTYRLEGPRLQRKIPDVLHYSEIQKMLGAIDLSHPQGTRNRAILETLYASGLRVSELVNLRLSNYYPELGMIRVVGKGNKERIIPIGESAMKYINQYINEVRRSQLNIDEGHSDFMFLNRRGRQLTRVMVFLVVKEAAKNAGLEKKVSPHTFRHSFATHLVEGGADLKAVQDMLGHESIITTEVYTHLDTDYLRETILSFHPRNHKKPRN